MARRGRPRRRLNPVTTPPPVQSQTYTLLRSPVPQTSGHDFPTRLCHCCMAARATDREMAMNSHTSGKQVENEWNALFGHFKKDCPQWKNKNHGNGNGVARAYAVGVAGSKPRQQRCDGELNKLTLKNRYPLPRIDDLFDSNFKGRVKLEKNEPKVQLHQMRVKKKTSEELLQNSIWTL
ncbi:hypothetical protein Tco_0818543 [Tanacetum coccineum]|uniref:Uncharacterized protein n=1 Tax=Tanacetum coccineum TaxID=301880 RepID=A0ABQ5FVV6_9ASTR